MAIFERDHDADQFYLLIGGYFHIERITANEKLVITMPITNNQLIEIAETLDHKTAPKKALPPWKRFHCLGQHICGLVGQFDGFASKINLAVGIHIYGLNNRIIAMASQQRENPIGRALLRLINHTGL